MRRLRLAGILTAALLVWASPAGAVPAWTVVASPNVAGSDFNQLDGIAATSSTDGWAVGFSRTTTPFRATVLHFNGTSWSLVPSAATPPSGDTRLHGIAALSATNAWAVGSKIIGRTQNSLIEHWNGSKWTIVASPGNEPTGSELHAAVAISSTDVWAVGYVFSISTITPLIEHYDGHAWTVVASPPLPSLPGRLLGIAGASANDVWAVGAMGRHSTPVIEHWDGVKWTLVAQPVNGYDSSLNAVTVISANDAWAVGEQNLNQTVTEHWDGTSWSLVASPFPTAHNAQNTLTGVASFGSNELWAVGFTLLDFAKTHTLTEHWDGTQWSIVNSPDPDGTYNALNGVAGLGAGQPLLAVGSRGQAPSHTLILQSTA